MNDRDIISALRVKLAGQKTGSITIGRTLAQTIVKILEDRSRRVKELEAEVERLNRENLWLSGGLGAGSD